jgi:hypothetical protein
VWQLALFIPARAARDADLIADIRLPLQARRELDAGTTSRELADDAAKHALTVGRNMQLPLT